MRTRLTLIPVLVILAGTGCNQKNEPVNKAAPGTLAEGPRHSPETPPPTEKRKLRIGIAIPSYVHAVAWIAQAEGIFARHGIDAEVVTMGGSSATMKGLVAGDIQVGLAGGDAAIKANLSGADLVVFGSGVTRHYHRLVVRVDIEKPEDLKGRTIGLPFLGGPQDFLVYVLCQKWGLEYGKDIKVQNMGKEYARLVAITDGTVDGITSAAPRSKLAKLGLRVLADPRTWDEPAPYMMMVARRAFLDKDRDLALDFLRALAEAQTFYLTQRDDALKVAFDKLGSKKGDARMNYIEGGPLMYAVPPVPDAEAMKTALDYIALNPDFASKAAGFDLGRMLNGSLVDSLISEGAYTGVKAAHDRLAGAMKAGRTLPAGARPGVK